MTSIQSVTLEVPDLSAASVFYSAAFDLRTQLDLRASEVPTSGFRAFTLSLVVSQPSTVDALIGAALDAGAMPLKPVKKSFWGYGGVIRAPDGTIWKVATSVKKNAGPATREVDEIVLLLGVSDVAASKRFYLDRGLKVAKSFGRKYVQFDTRQVKLALYGRRALAKDAGVPPDGTGPPDRHRQRRRLVHRPGRVRVGASRPAPQRLRRARLRRPRSRRQPDPHRDAALSRPAIYRQPKRTRRCR